MVKLALVFGVFVLYALVSHKTERWFAAPVVFATLGVILSDTFLGWFTLDLDSTLLQVLLKGALALLLFSEATTLNSEEIRADASLPVRLLGISMPLVIIFGLAIAGVVFGILTFWEAALVGIILAPTDAALGQAVVENERVPVGIRRGLIVESGLNDGLAVPLALFAAGAAEVVAGTRETPDLVTLILQQVGLGIAVGLALGWAAAALLRYATAHHWATDAWLSIGLAATAAAGFALAEGIGGNGFIATWLAGLALGRWAHAEVAGHRDFSMNVSTLLASLSFVVFGALSIGPLLQDWQWDVFGYAVLSLLIIRPLAVWISLRGTGHPFNTAAFIGWFGPRGIASIVLVLIIVKGEFSIASFDLIDEIMTATVALSIYAHGFTAGPLSDRYATWAERAPSV